MNRSFSLLCLLLTSAALAAGEPVSSLAVGRRFTKHLWKGETTTLWAMASPALRKQLGNEEALNAFREKVVHDFGSEVRTVSEAMQTRGTVTVYTRNALTTHYARGVELQWLWDEAGQLVSYSARPSFKEAPTPYLATKPKTQLRPPFEGAWNVLWGGRTWDENRHASVSDQRFALDLLIWKDQGTFSGNGTRNEQYNCWGKTVVAPAEGTVVIAEDSVADNQPGQVNTVKLYGNHLVIDHGNGEFSLLGHLMLGSLKVRVGDTVHRGQALARAGNSGTSTEPHLHYQLMDAPFWVKAHGLPVFFTDYLSDGRPMGVGEPKRGQNISAIAPGARPQVASGSNR